MPESGLSYHWGPDHLLKLELIGYCDKQSERYLIQDLRQVDFPLWPEGVVR
jgi:hypothetical protein